MRVIKVGINIIKIIVYIIQYYMYAKYNHIIYDDVCGTVALQMKGSLPGEDESLP